ncbi:uncharacterized protein BDZ99DRAFT_494912 [Mytilinidion resinicola]|uniref:Uncharacterized protein n=1 Tax=Mytilinidion resinicola TaxID=574789 RepID=A0A6A6Z442_9PEZI|nr:uncharacterized protein BDZ99DRAFT_494912 [Mytilinidion resinicola]KAF2815054.1 hypothetical protein BDZ99DRAFT_494912 [Mytilinidion resinicola]
MAPGPPNERAHKHHEPSISSLLTDDSDQADQASSLFPVPIHPLESMQGPFEESMLDATGDSPSSPFQSPAQNAELRHQVLCKASSKALESEWNFTYNCYWRDNPRAKFHPLRKTVAQVAFGVHLLHQHLEKSVSDVADILQKHVHELDTFLQRANEDMESGLKDMLFRCNCLQVPMEHVSEFDRLLEDRQYRAQLLDGNITIERTIQRMSQVMNDYLVDLQTLKDANNELDTYLENIGDEWTDENDDVGRIYSAMCGNALGWSQYVQNLISKTEKLGLVLVRVGSYCNEIEKRCGAASRRSLIASRSSSRNSSSKDGVRSFKNFADNKPLPTVPKDQYSKGSLSPPRSASASGHYNYPEKRQSSLTGEVQQAAGRSGSTPDLALVERQHKPIESAKDSRTHVQDKKRTSKLDDKTLLSGNISDPLEPGDDKSIERGRSRHTGKGKYSEPEKNGTVDFSPSDTSTMKNRLGNRDTSPPLTAQDSAYSSVSGSFASPAIIPSIASPTPISQRRVTLGLFPSSAPPTPKFAPGGHSNASGLTLPLYTRPLLQEERSQSQLSSRSARRMLKKPSLSSLKNFFTRKKASNTVGVIKE